MLDAGGSTRLLGYPFGGSILEGSGGDGPNVDAVAGQGKARLFGMIVEQQVKGDDLFVIVAVNVDLLEASVMLLLMLL